MNKRRLIYPRDWTVLGPLIDDLCDLAEGASVTVCHDNPDFGGPNCVIYACNPATNWVEKSYRGETVERCLRDALSDDGMWELVGVVVPSSDELLI
jgi:hypothetical protein